MFFLAKCLVCIALVLVALHLRPLDASAPQANLVSSAARPRLDDALRGLMQNGAEALAGAARDRCLAAPRDCAAALQRLQTVRDR